MSPIDLHTIHKIKKTSTPLSFHYFALSILSVLPFSSCLYVYFGLHNITKYPNPEGKSVFGKLVTILDQNQKRVRSLPERVTDKPTTVRHQGYLDPSLRVPQSVTVVYPLQKGVWGIK